MFLTTLWLMVVCVQLLLYFLIRIYDLSILYHFLDYSHWLESRRMIMYSFYKFKDILVAESSALLELDIRRRLNSHAWWKSKKGLKNRFPDIPRGVCQKFGKWQRGFRTPGKVTWEDLYGWVRLKVGEKTFKYSDYRSKWSTSV